MTFADKYTTEELKSKDPIKEKDKIVITNDTYALCELLTELNFRLIKHG